MAVSINFPLCGSHVKRTVVAKGTSSAKPEVRIENPSGVAVYVVPPGSVTYPAGGVANTWEATFGLTVDYLGMTLVAELPNDDDATEANVSFSEFPPIQSIDTPTINPEVINGTATISGTYTAGRAILVTIFAYKRDTNRLDSILGSQGAKLKKADKTWKCDPAIKIEIPDPAKFRLVILAQAFNARGQMIGQSSLGV